MAKHFQPLTLQVTTSPRRLRAQLLAAWPTAPHASARLRAIKTITTHIKDSLPTDYKGDISVFISNQATTIHEPVTQGFLYHLTSQQIVNRQPVKKSNNTALLHVHFTATQSADEAEEELKNAETTPVSRIQQIKQWQKETVKAMFQAMADTAISMESQTALRGTMAGLNKLGALLNKAVAAQKLPQSIAKVAAQKTSSRDIASTLSDLRSNLSLASGNGLKPPTKSQLALRQQLNKLDKIAPTLQKPAVKTTPVAKSAPAAKAATQIKTAVGIKAAKTIPTPAAKATVSSRPLITQRFNIKAEPVRIARISIQPLRLNTVAKTYVAPRLAAQSTPIRILPRRVITPARIVARIAQRIALPVKTAPAQRYTATKTIVQKIVQRPVAQTTTAIAPILSRPTTRRFQISRPIIAQLRITPTIIAAHQALRAPNNVTEAKTKTEPVKQEKQTPPPINPPKDITPKDTKALAATTKVALQPNIIATQSLGSKIPLRHTRSPAVYAALSPIIAPLRQATVAHSQPIVTVTAAPISTPRITPQTPPQPAQQPTHTQLEAPATRSEQVTQPHTQKQKSVEIVTTQEKLQEPAHAAIEAKQNNKTGEVSPTRTKSNDAQPVINPTPTAAPRTEGKPIEPIAAPPTTNQATTLPVRDVSPPPSPLPLPVTPTVLPPIPNPTPINHTPTNQPPITPRNPEITPRNPEPIETKPTEAARSNVLPFRQPDKVEERLHNPIITDKTIPTAEIFEFKEIKRPVAYNSIGELKKQWIERDRTFVQTGTGGRDGFLNTDFNHSRNQEIGGRTIIPKLHTPATKEEEKPTTPNKFYKLCPCTGRLMLS